MVLRSVLCLAAAAALARVDAVPRELYGLGKCGITQTFASYQGRMVSNQRIPAWNPVPSPGPWAFVDVNVEFRPSTFTIELSSPTNASKTLKCLFTCGVSKVVPNYIAVTQIAVVNASYVSGDRNAFGCLPPNETSAGRPDQILTSLIANNCGNVDGVMNGTNYFEIQFEPYYKSAASVASNWIQNMTLQSLSGQDFDHVNATGYNQTYSFKPWLTCPCDTGVGCQNGPAVLDVTISLRANPIVDWGLTTPVYARDGFLFTMLLILLFAIGWVSMFVAAYRPKCLREDDDFSESEEESDGEEEPGKRLPSSSTEEGSDDGELDGSDDGSGQSGEEDEEDEDEEDDEDLDSKPDDRSPGPRMPVASPTRGPSAAARPTPVSAGPRPAPGKP